MNTSSEIICGKHSVFEALRAGKRKCFEIFFADGKDDGKRDETLHAITLLANQHRIPIRTLRTREMATLTRVERHQGVACRIEPFRFSEFSVLENAKLVLLLDGILDPQNLGSLLRTAHQAGVESVILPKHGSAPVGPATSRAAAGAVEYLPIVQVTNMVSTLTFLKDKGFWIYGASSEGTQSLYELDFRSHPVALVLGAEGRGMRRLTEQTCDFLVFIPMKGKVDSFNVSVAGAILLSEIQRQRLYDKKSPKTA